MTLNRRIGLGVLIDVDPAGGSSYGNLGSIVGAGKESGTKADTADISILTDIFKQKAKGQIDPGEHTFTIAYDPDDSTYTTLKSLHDAIQTTPPTWKVRLPSGTQGAGTTTFKTFAAFVTGLSKEYEKDKMLMADVTITKTGDPGT